MTATFYRRAWPKRTDACYGLVVALAPDTLLKDRLARFCARHGGVQLAVLFGSRARSVEQPTSDVDLAVEAPGVDLATLAADLGVDLGEAVDVLDLNAATIPMMQALIQDGIIVFECGPGVAASWRSRILMQLETDLPWYRRMRDAWLRQLAECGFPDGQ
jgi:predicted nucleotidyltransferase